MSISTFSKLSSCFLRHLEAVVSKTKLFNEIYIHLISLLHLDMFWTVLSALIACSQFSPSNTTNCMVAMVLLVTQCGITPTPSWLERGV